MKTWKVETTMLFHLVEVTITCWNLLCTDRSLNQLSIKVSGTDWLCTPSVLLMICNNPILINLLSLSPVHSGSSVLSAWQYVESVVNMGKSVLVSGFWKWREQRKYLPQVSQIVADLELQAQLEEWQQVAEPVWRLGTLRIFKCNQQEKMVGTN